MERENNKLRAKKRKAEASRIQKLVDLSYQNDPRVQAEKQRAKDAKTAAKAEREEQVNAATKVQALHRGNSSRKNTGVVGKKGETSFSDSLAEYLTKISDWWKNDVVEGKTMTKVRGLPCLAVRSQDNREINQDN